MPTDKRRAAGRRRAWGRGPVILRFEPLEDRKLLATSPLADLVGGAFDTLHNLDWGDSFHAKGVVGNIGGTAVVAPFHVNIYASPTPSLGPQSVLLGQATISGGVQPGGQASFDQVVKLPTTGGENLGAVYINTLIDPEGVVAESNTQNNSGAGQGYDTSVVTITPHLPSALSGASLGVYPDQAQWGGAVQVNARVQNDGAGDAPATRARVVLTPAGATPGGVSDVTVGSIDVPAVPANQGVTVSQSVTLPQFPPAVLLGSTSFTLSLAQDADFAADSFSPHTAYRGTGADMTPIAIALPANYSAKANVPRPDLTATKLQAPSLPLVFGQTFQVTATVQNLGNLDSGPYRVRFLLVGTDGSLVNSLFLGDATEAGLKAGYGQDLVQTVSLPAKLPNGAVLNSGSTARIAVVVDPEHVLDDGNPSNNVAVSNVVTLKLVATDGTTSTPVTTTPQTPVKAVKTPVTPAPAGSPQTPAAKKRAKSTPHHTISHNLKVFPERLGKSITKLFK